MKIVVLAGGISPERAVSLVSGAGVCRALRGNGHRAVLVDMFLGIEEVPEDLDTLFDAPDGRCPDVSIGVRAPDLEEVRRARRDQGPSHLGPHVLEICAASDLVFLGLHGQDGEDGRIQAALELLGVPYTGSGHLASAIAMDKIVAKRMMDAAGLSTPRWRELCYGPEDVEGLVEELPLPCVIKTAGGGSSLGVYLPEDREELRRALTEVLRYGGRVLAEERIYGREFGVAVLGDRWLPAIEAVSSGKGFDYTEKYQPGAVRELCPAPLEEDQMRAAGELALSVHRCLGLEVYSRADILMDEEGRFWCLEINSLPGMTPTSFVPQEAAAAGVDYPQLCEEIVRMSLALDRRNG